MLIRQHQVSFQITLRESGALGRAPSSVVGGISLSPEWESRHDDSINSDGLFRGHGNGCEESSKAMQMSELG